MMRRRYILYALAAGLLFSGCTASVMPVPEEESPPTEEESEPAITLHGTQSIVIEGFDWGPAVTGIMLTLEQPVSPDSVTADAFSVTERKESLDDAAYTEWSAAGSVGAPPSHVAKETVRKVHSAFVCDAKGRTVSDPSERIMLALDYGPDTGSPWYFDRISSHNTPCDPYELAVSLNSRIFTENGVPVDTLDISPFIHLDDEEQVSMPQIYPADLTGSFTGDHGQTLLYASYSPVQDGRKHPLVVWLHGAGEGGYDPAVPLLGNKVTALLDEEFQSIMGGAFVLVPQAPDFWMVYDETGNWQDNPGVSSIYNTTLMQLVADFVEHHADIDPERIYIGGCSNGGYMTMDMILTHPDYFAAAFPICEAYPDSAISDLRLDGIKNLPVWFVYAENDDVVDPAACTIPTVQRLREMGADVHISAFPKVTDTSGLYKGSGGKAYEYPGHWSWICFFNNECAENGVKLWDWLSGQHR